MQANLKCLVKECIKEVLIEDLLEGFDPLSQGPNPTYEENPYPRWNSYMSQLEEDNMEVPSGDPITKIKSDTTHYIPTIKVVRFARQYLGDEEFKKKVMEKIKSLYKNIPITDENWAEAIENVARETTDLVRKQVQQMVEWDTNPHGRYAQEAGAGQFDPRTFGLNK